MANAYIEACTFDEIEHLSNAQEGVVGTGCEDPSNQMWPDTDEELTLGLSVASSRNELASTCFRTPCERSTADDGIVRDSVFWADMVDEVGHESGAPGSHSITTFPDPGQTLWSQLEAIAGCGRTGDAIAVPLAGVESDPRDVETSSIARPLLRDLDAAFSMPCASKGTTSIDARSYPSSFLLPHLLRHAAAQELTRLSTPHSCTSVSLRPRVATLLSSASLLNIALSESETSASQSQVASFKNQGMSTGAGPSFRFDESPACLSASASNCRVPAAAGPHGVRWKTSKGKASATSSSSTRSTLQEAKDIGAQALKKALAMLTTVNLKPSEDPATSPLKSAGASPSSLEGAHVVNRRLPNLLHGHQSDGVLKCKSTSRQEKLARECMREQSSRP